MCQIAGELTRMKMKQLGVDPRHTESTQKQAGKERTVVAAASTIAPQQGRQQRRERRHAFMNN